MNISYEYLKRPVWLICLDVVSSVPDRFVDPFFGELDEGFKYWLSLRDFFKMIHVIYYGYYRLHMVRHQRIALALCNYFMTMFGLYVSIHYLFFVERCDHQICDAMDRVYNIANAAAAITYRLLCEITTNEIIVPMQLAFSYITYFGVIIPMVAEMVTAIINENSHESAFEHKKQVALTSLANTNTPQIVKTKLADFFQLHWQKQDGYNDSDLKSFLIKLAPSVREELMVDMNFAAMKHSKLFQNMDLAFLRCVALEMEQTYLLPGETLCQKGSNKHKMIYVVSGIVQILSDRDGDTAVLSLSAGSCLGETTLIVNYNATATVVCKEYCMLQTLTMDKFVSIGKKFPKQMQRLRKMVWNRYGMAKKLKILGKVLETKRGVDQKERRVKIAWLNNTLHRLMMKDEDTFGKHMCQNILLREELESNAYETMTSTATYLDLLAVTERTELVTDSVFLHYACPPILQPNSILLNVWDVMVCLLAFFACCAIPIYSLVNPYTPKWYWYLVNFCTVLYITDVYLRIITAVKMKNEIIGNLKDISTYRLGTLSFWLDMIAAYPFELHANVILHTVSDMFYARLYLNRCFKFAKILVIYTYYSKRSKHHKTLLTYIQYIFLITYLILVFGSIEYWHLCKKNNNCFVKGKVKMEKVLESVRLVAIFLYMLGMAFIEQVLKKLFAMYLTCCVISGTILVLLLAAIVSNEIMSSYVQIHIIQLYSNLKEIVDCLKIEQTCQRRIFDYVNMQWDYDSAQRLLSSTDVFTEMPEATYKLFKEHMFQSFIRDMPLFKELSDEIILELCAIAQVEVLPPKEVVYYQEIAPTVIYYLIDGFVELVSGPKTKTIAGPGSSLSVFEAYLDLPQLNTCVTLTHCKLLVLPWNPVKMLIVKNDFYDVVVDWTDLKDQFLEFSEIHKIELTYDLGSKLEIPSFRNFGYNLIRNSLEEYEYHVPFDRLLQFSFIRYFLLRVTVLPNGNFVFWWELSRAIFAIVSAVLFTVPPVLTCQDCYSWWILLFLDLTALLDIYLRCHYCYYNDKGLLVSHPLKTALHYIKHAFLTDLIGVLPLRFCFSASQSKLNSILHFTRSIQLYRVYFFIRQRSFVPRTTLTMARYLLIILVSTSIVASLLVNIYCDFRVDIPASKNYVEGMKCMSMSFFERNLLKKPVNAIKSYVISFHFSSQLLSNTRNLIYISHPKVWYLLIEHILTICGYCLYIYLVAKFTILLSKQSDLLRYQRDLYLLKIFLKQQKVDLGIQEEMIQHYYLQWEKNRGAGVHRMTERFHRTLKRDVVYNVYGNVLETSSIFEEGHRQFYRKLLMKCKHEAFAGNSTICCVNDITSVVYILYEGCVKVIAPDGTLLTLLGVGSMFGNLDEFPKVRQTLGFVAKENVELLIVQTDVWYQNLQFHPKLYKTFKYLTVLHIDYLKGRFETETNKEEDTEDHNGVCKCLITTKMLPYKIWRFIQLFIVCYLISILQIYMIAVIETNHSVFILLYLADILYVIDAVFVQYHTAVFDETGKLITNLRKKRNQNRLLLLIRFTSSFPIDVPIWFLPISSYWRYRMLLYLRLNKQLRLCHLFIYFEKKKKQLSSNHTFLRCATLTCFVVLLMQILNCCYIKVQCFESDVFTFGIDLDCLVLNNPDGDSIDKCWNYLKHFVVIAALLLSASQTYHISFSFYSTFCISLLTLATLIVTTFMFAEIFCILRNSVYWRSVYEERCCHLLNFMKRREVSEQLVKKVWNYVRFFWKRQNGVTFPELLVVAPTPLKSKVFGFCYSYHIKKNVIFEKCHEDFVRQLVLMLKMDSYFPGDYVVFKGDINDCMYFIHKGSVLVLSEDTYRKEDIVGELFDGQSFGILQGLYPSTPHVYYYQVASNSDILSLNREIWMYLLDYFPASKEVIYNAAESYLGF